MAQVIAYPDLQVITSTSQISIGNPTPSTRELRFSHVTWDAGTGPLEIRPTYNASTNQAWAVITPAAGQIASGSVTVTANATDNVALAPFIRFYSF